MRTDQSDTPPTWWRSSLARNCRNEPLRRRRHCLRRDVSPADVAALAVHIMTNTSLTGATFDVNGGQQLIT